MNILYGMLLFEDRGIISHNSDSMHNQKLINNYRTRLTLRPSPAPHTQGTQTGGRARSKSQPIDIELAKARSRRSSQIALGSLSRPRSECEDLEKRTRRSLDYRIRCKDNARTQQIPSVYRIDSPLVRGILANVFNSLEHSRC